MDIKPNTMTISQLLSSRCQFSIPRFQREYSWEKQNYKEFIDDTIECLKVENGTITDTPYFLGTMLVIGNLELAGQTLDVVDGQQRLTIITILFSAISDHFIEAGNDKLSERIFQYIMTEDDDGNKVRVLKSNTHYPFFSYYIQDRKKEQKKNPTSEEEICIKETFNYLYQRTTEKSLRGDLYKKYGRQYVDSISYENILKALRDQVLKSLVVIISTSDKKDANSIFEILNAKGKRLASVDLIKNQIFSVAMTTEPADFADLTWSETKEILYSGKETVGITTFFRHYWVSKYTSSSEAQLYDKFVKTIKPANEDNYKKFLLDMKKNANYYMQIINPSRNDYENRKEYFWLVQSFDYLSNKFNIVQVRIALMAILEAKENELISSKRFKELIQYLEGFHFVYNTVLSRAANLLDSRYATFARNLRKCNSKSEANECIKELRTKLDKLYPTFNDFKDEFVRLEYSKMDLPDNLKVKYIINKLCCYYSQSKEEVFDDGGSIEHIYPEGKNEKIALNIGNLILLEMPLNSEAEDRDYVDKISIYQKSKYDWIKKFMEKHVTWSKDEIADRAELMADIYYHEILGRR
jgi:uncharacterized protein with ParB-like and HNH nuclease domain